MIPSEQLLASLPIAAYITDADGTITFYNDAAAEMWGCEPALGQKWCGSFKLFQSDGTPLPHDECPMAQALKQGKAIRGVEAVLERPDGSRVPFMPSPTPVYDADGKLTGAVNILIDLRSLGRAQDEAARLAAIVSSSDDAIVSKTLDGNITSWNAGAERIFGYTADEMIGQSIMRIIPPNLRDEEKSIIARLAQGERIEHFETVRVTKDGRSVDISLTVSPLHDKSGRVVGASKVARDISERKRAEETQQLLHNELNHRIKNTLATVQAIASQTLQRAATPAAFVISFNGRIQALSRAHGVLTAGSFQGAEITQMVRDQLLLGGADDARITWSGPELTLPAQLALHLALVLHELGTNARKHGALSVATGKVAVRWELQTNGERTLSLDWTESGGPKVIAPSARGFGTTLIEQSLQAHGGDALMRYSENGASCAIKLPLPVLQALVSTRTPFQSPHLAPAPPVRGGLQGRRVLIIEDEPLIAMVLTDYLSDVGCEAVGPAQSVAKALAAIQEQSFDAALVDGNLAGQPVGELALALTQKGAPFAFVTGYGREALPYGFQNALMVEKPFSQEQIVATLDQLLNTEPNIVALKANAAGA